MAEPSHAQLSREIGELTATVAAGQKAQDDRLGKIERKLESVDSRLNNVEVAAGFGRGIGWTLIKVGVVLSAILAAVAGWWDRLTG